MLSTKRDGTPRRARLKVIDGFGKNQIHAFVLDAVVPNTRLVTDDWPSYNDTPEIKHKAITVGPMAAHIVLLGSIACSQTSSAGAWACTTAREGQTFSTTWTSSCSASIGATHVTRRSILSSASAHAPPRLPTTS
jgi:hypothetical protein